jgi:hypothetical protein
MYMSVVVGPRRFGNYRWERYSIILEKSERDDYRIRFVNKSSLSPEGEVLLIQEGGSPAPRFAQRGAEGRSASRLREKTSDRRLRSRQP